jgi:hypothetical protein
MRTKQRLFSCFCIGLLLLSISFCRPARIQPIAQQHRSAGVQVKINLYVLVVVVSGLLERDVFVNNIVILSCPTNNL